MRPRLPWSSWVSPSSSSPAPWSRTSPRLAAPSGCSGCPTSGESRGASLDHAGHPGRASSGGRVPGPSVRPFPARSGRLRGLRGQGPGGIPGGRHQEAGNAASGLQLHGGWRKRSAVRVHLPQLPPRLLHLRPRGDSHDDDLRRGLRHPVGLVRRRAHPLRRAAPVSIPDPGVADRDLRRGLDSRADTQAGGLRHPPVRGCGGILSFGEPFGEPKRTDTRKEAL